MFTPNRNRNLTPRRGTPKSLRKSLLSSNAKNQSFGEGFVPSSPNSTLIFGSDKHSFQSCTPSLPIHVKEYVSLTPDLSKITADLSANGWSWSVQDKLLYIWNHKPFPMFKNSVCKKLQIPFSDCYTDLVCVQCKPKNPGHVSVLAASRSGNLCYWENIFSTSSKLMGTVKLSGSQADVCYRVRSIEPCGFLVCTSTRGMHHVIANSSTLTSMALKKSGGTLSGIGRRVSSLFFAPATEEASVVEVLVKKVDADLYRVLVLTINDLQEWLLRLDGSVVSVCDVQEVDFKQITEQHLTGYTWVQPLDLKLITRNSEILVLFALAVKLEEGAAITFKVCHFKDIASLSQALVIPFDYTATYYEEKLDDLDISLLVEDPDSRILSDIALCWRDHIVFKTLLDEGREHQEDDVTLANQEQILGGGERDGRFILLTSQHGMVMSSTSSTSLLPPSVEESVLQNSFSMNDSSSSLPPPPQGVAVGGSARDMEEQLERLETSEDNTLRLRAAFLHYCRHNVERAQRLISETFDQSRQGSLDECVVTMSSNLLDDFPASDPRWAESLPEDVLKEASLQQQGSLLLINQLQDKQNAHAMFITFLTKCGIWKRLSRCHKGKALLFTTRQHLLEHGEKLAAAIALYHKHSSCSGVLDVAVRKLLSERDSLAKRSALTIKDVYYREVSKMDDLFEHLMKEQVQIVDDVNTSSAERFNTIITSCAIFEEVVASALASRERNRSQLEAEDAKFEAIPWTVRSRDNDLRKFALEQHKLMLERGLLECGDGHDRSVMLRSLTSLVDLLLTDYHNQLASIPPNNNTDDDSTSRHSDVLAAYERDRHRLLVPLLDINEVDLLVKLAEKHKDFNLLIRACVKMDKQDLLMTLMKKYQSHGFCEFAFNYFLDNGQHRALLNCCGNDQNLNNQLQDFLAAHPKLAWMHQTRTNDFTQASETLRFLAEEETASVAAKKNYLSLSKLASVFSDTPQDQIDEIIQDINTEQDLLKYEESLPLAVIEEQNMEYENMPVLSPEQLIELYTGDANKHANEIDFKKALELLRYIPVYKQDHSDAIDELKAKIWCRAVERDAWDDIDANGDYFVDFAHTTFFKLLRLITDNFEELAPDVNKMLTRDEVSKMVGNSLFEHLVKTSVERVAATVDTTLA